MLRRLSEPQDSAASSGASGRAQAEVKMYGAVESSPIVPKPQPSRSFLGVIRTLSSSSSFSGKRDREASPALRPFAPPGSPYTASPSISTPNPHHDDGYRNTSEEDDGQDSDPKRRKHGGISLTLLNNGSVARDHLATERTFLAYVRTSLGVAMAGVALTQFLKLTTKSKPFAAPMGALAICIGILVLIIGTFRFFAIQHALPLGIFPAARISVAVIALLVGTLVTIAFGVVLSGRVA